MPTPSLILVPARFKTGKLYTPVATTSGGLVLGASGDFNVTRATTATRVNASGLIEVVASGIPRLDYPLGGGCPALLVEPAATNLFSGSADLGNTTYWSRPAGANVTGNVSGIIAPDGTQTATLFQASGTTATNSRLRQTWSRTTTGAHAMSVFIRGFAGVAASGQVVCGVGASELNFAITSGGVITLTSMTGGAAAVTSGIVNYGNGWYRITAVGTAATSGSTQSELYCSPSGGPQYYAWGAQVETGSVATSYIPTTTAPLTRNADVINLSGAVSGCIGQTEGTIYAEVDSRNQQTGRIVSFQIAGTVGSGQVRVETVGASLRCRVINASGTTVYDQTASPAMSVGINKVAFAFNSAASGIVIALNGSIINTGTASASTVHNATQLTIGAQDSIAGFGSFYNDRIRAVAIYSTRLTNAELQSLTTL